MVLGRFTCRVEGMMRVLEAVQFESLEKKFTIPDPHAHVSPLYGSQ